jgi:DNA-directed RNA polymerase specialized sigma24 family protein
VGSAGAFLSESPSPDRRDSRMVAATRGGRLPTGPAPEHVGERGYGCTAPVAEGGGPLLDTILVRRAVGGDRAAARIVVTRLAPTVQRSVIHILMGHGHRNYCHQEVEDLVQDAFAALFSHGGRELLRWDPNRGMRLESFVGLVTKRLTISKLRVREVKAVSLPPSESSAEGPSPAADEAFTAREDLHALGERLRATLSPLGLTMFHRLFVLDQTVEEICRDAGMSADAVYQWRKRLRDTIEEIRERAAVPAASAS